MDVDVIKRCVKVECTSLLGMSVSVFPETEPTEWKRTAPCVGRAGPGKKKPSSAELAVCCCRSPLGRLPGGFLMASLVEASCLVESHD